MATKKAQESRVTSVERSPTGGRACPDNEHSYLTLGGTTRSVARPPLESPLEKQKGEKRRRSTRRSIALPVNCLIAFNGRPISKVTATGRLAPRIRSPPKCRSIVRNGLGSRNATVLPVVDANILRDASERRATAKQVDISTLRPKLLVHHVYGFK